jgi:putative transposase
VSRICLRLRKSRAAYYKQVNGQNLRCAQDCVIREMVIDKRRFMPRVGGKKLYRLLKGQMDEHLIHIGRDKFFTWLRNHDLLVKSKKRYTKTTNSYHRFRMHKNLIKQLEVSHPDQLWVSDITYLKLQKGFCYLALITDVFSRKIVGYDISASLELNGCLRALKMACAHKKSQQTIHHSDRGFQYCSNPYLAKLKENGIQVSMAEVGNCYENALAERVNGILKDEFNLDAVFKDLGAAQKAGKQAIETYNEMRPHWSIGMKIPNELYAA